jgi:hypothetical protein
MDSYITIVQNHINFNIGDLIMITDSTYSEDHIYLNQVGMIINVFIHKQYQLIEVFFPAINQTETWTRGTFDRFMTWKFL